MSRPSVSIGERAALLTDFGPTIRTRMLEQGWRADSCIGATRMGMDILKSIGVTDMYALSVRCYIFNQPFAEHAERVGRIAESPEETVAWEAEDGSWAIGLGFEPTVLLPNRWPGHLVLIVERRLLWDLSIDQANRPQHGIVFDRPVVLPVTEPFLRDRERLTTAWRTPIATLQLAYEARPGDKSFRKSPNWTEAQARVTVTTIGGNRRP